MTGRRSMSEYESKTKNEKKKSKKKGFGIGIGTRIRMKSRWIEKVEKERRRKMRATVDHGKAGR